MSRFCQPASRVFGFLFAGMVVCSIVSCSNSIEQDIDGKAFESQCRESELILPEGGTVVANSQKHGSWFIIFSTTPIPIPKKYEATVRPADPKGCFECMQPLVPGHDFGIVKAEGARHALLQTGVHSAIDFKMMETTKGHYLYCRFISRR